jgi:hypothetical protein
VGISHHNYLCVAFLSHLSPPTMMSRLDDDEDEDDNEVDEINSLVMVLSTLMASMTLNKHQRMAKLIRNHVSGSKVNQKVKSALDVMEKMSPFIELPTAVRELVINFYLPTDDSGVTPVPVPAPGPLSFPLPFHHPYCFVQHLPPHPFQLPPDGVYSKSIWCSYCPNGPVASIPRFAYR